MSLKGSDIRAATRLTLKGARIKWEKPTEPKEPPLVSKLEDHKPARDQDREDILRRMIAKNPLVAVLVDRFDLIEDRPGAGPSPKRTQAEEPARETKEIGKLHTGNEYKKEEAPRISKEARTKLEAIVTEALEEANSYTEEEVISRIIQSTRVNRERAEKGFKMILQAGLLELVPGGLYHLKSSTPF